MDVYSSLIVGGWGWERYCPLLGKDKLFGRNSVHYFGKGKLSFLREILSTTWER